ncbi:ATP-binding protein [Sphingomonas sp.]|uniref:ATP-binding protein n=1 Tax=Sphingomonas sp. TaxID=28214 RepID=UPI002DD624C1|nr:ATP-binding protein [Sphingomonas sp.]
MARDDHGPTTHDVRIGKDLLELVSSAMYVEPLTAYREYLQNAADAIDDARRRGMLAADEPGRVEVTLDQRERVVRIRDNGTAIPRADVLDRLLALGGSGKRGTEARGFRGVGRLAALGYAQYLTFRTRAQDEDLVTEVTWDARRLRAALADPDAGDLASVVAHVVDVRVLPAADSPPRFFEVEIGKIVRQRGDRLLDPVAVHAYLSQVAPLPFAPQFHHGAAIVEALRAVGPLAELQVTIDGGEPITRPHRDAIDLGASTTDIHELTLLELPGMDGGLAAVGWFAHHDYRGAIPVGALAKGVRVRAGNIQVGDHTILEQIFPEARFNAWTVGEVHILDRRIVPNGRRDEFEANTHYANLVNQLSPIGRDIARRCRTSSTQRSKLREFESAGREAAERLAVIGQGAISDGTQAAEMGRVFQSVARMRKVLDAEALEEGRRATLENEVAAVEAELARVGGGVEADPLDMVPKGERATYRKVFELIYECSANRVAAKALVDRMIQRLAE